ncbi:MAG: tetraacyldisaccharide 4'-kinase [Phycisphaerales bacterium]
MTNPPPDPRAPLPAGLGAPFAPLYRLAVARRNRRFDRGVDVRRAMAPVVSVGNLSVGGAGKTPMVRHIVEALRLAGRRPGIVLRGYKSRGGTSDEEAEHRAALPGVPVVANPDRYRAVADLIARSKGPRIDCVVLDDGFQHRRLAREVDIVLIDATRDPWEDALLPAGWLREPVSSLARATAVVITHAESVAPSAIEALRKRIEIAHGKPPIAVCAHEWFALRIFDGRVDAEVGLDWLEGKRVVATCAIARPRPFLNALRDARTTVVSSLPLRDHAAYGPGRVRRLIEMAESAGADAIVCTEKDWMKLRRHPADAWPCPVVRPGVRHVFLEGAEALDAHVVEGVGGRK